ncbi:MAG: SRPBCC family protein [Pseudonocardia sp.]|nr:SRPBCC family protein [Pseudonocardia sp.]
MENPSYSESIFIACPPDVLYRLVSDVTRMGGWSPICKACWWENDARGVGAWFIGRNELPERTWETRSQVVVAEPGREFAFMVGGDLVRWGYSFNSAEGGTLLTESWQFLPAGRALFSERYGADAPAQIADRIQTARTGIPTTLATIKKTAESAD